MLPHPSYTDIVNLRTRLLIVTFIALAIFVGAFYLLAGMTIDRTFARADSRTVERQVLRVHSYLDHAPGTVGGICSDWAYWDDTYQFVIDRNAAYVESNLAPSSLATVDVDIMVFLDIHGKAVHVSLQTVANQTLDDTVTDLVKQLRSGTALWMQAMVDPGLTGYLQVGERVVMVAARPILTSATTGPARGVLVFVRYLDEVFFTSMVETIGGNVTLQPAGLVQPETIESQALALLAKGQPTIGLPTGTDEVRGFMQLADLSGRTTLLLSTTAKRTQSAEVARLKRMVVAATSVVGAVLAVLAMFFVNGTVLKRVASLSRQVKEVGHTSDLSMRVHLSGSDEFSQLATDVNSTLESLKQTQRDKDQMARESEQDRKRLHDYFDHAHDLIFALDTDGKVIAVNQSTCSVLGYDEQDLLGRNVVDVVSPESREFAVSANDAIQRADSVATTTVDVVTRDGDRRTLEVSGQRLLDDGQLTGTFYIARDITDRLRMEHELLRNEAMESLGTLAAGIAHDFNNVLTVVKGNISLANSSLDEPADSQRYLEVARVAVDRAQALASQLLTFSRGGAPVKENVDVESTVQEVARFALSGSSVALQVHVEGIIPAVEADRNQLFQVMQNIILNARDAMPSGGTLNIDLRHEAVSEEHPIGFAAIGDCVIIQIADTGPGIPPEDMKRLFDPFFTTKASGHGVGLATARSIARRHRGDLIIESTTGKGTTVRLCMPAAPGPATQARLAKPEGSPRSATGHLLVMDDEQTVADVTCAMARRLGYETTAVPDGEAALTVYAQAVAEQHAFDLVIMDLTIPGGMGGREAVQRLHELHPEARVIVSSGYSDDASIAEYTQCGFIASLSKPYTMEQLERVLRESSRPPLSS